MFRDQTATVTRRASALSDSSASASGSGTLTRQPTPEKEILARSFFFRHFVTANHLTFLEGVSPDEYLLKSITACGLAALANKGNDVAGREMARRHYIQAISATNSALQHPRKVREDNTLISVFLLGVFEVRREVFAQRVPANLMVAFDMGTWKFCRDVEAPCAWLCAGPAATRSRPGHNTNRSCAI